MKKLIFVFLSLLLGLSSAFANKEVHVISANDMHANIQRMPRLAAIVDSMRALYPSLLVLSAGDNRTGEPLNDMYHIPAYPMVALMNQIGFTATALGNHEFDGGVQNLGQLIGSSNFSYLCCNIRPVPEWGIYTKPYQIYDVNGVRVGIIGVVQLGMRGTPDTHPNNVVGLKFEPVNESIEHYSWLRDQCDVIILLSHIGIDDDEALSQNMSWLDLIVGGHTHTQLTPCAAPHGVVITQNINRLERVTHTTITLDDNNKVDHIGCENIEVGDGGRVNEIVQLMVDHFGNNPDFKRVLGQNLEPISKYEEFGCLMADAYRAQGGADVGFVNYGGVRIETFPAGPFTVNDALSLDPFQNDAVLLELTGEELRQMLISCYYHDRNRLPVTSGVLCRITYDKRDKKQIKDLKLLTPDGKKFNMKKTYKVVTNNFVPSITDSPGHDRGKALNYQTAQMIIDYVDSVRSFNYKGCVRAIVR